MVDPISAGLTALSVGSSLFGLFNNQSRVNPAMSAAYNQMEMQNSQLEQARMNLDATRRKRDIIRQAQVATAQAENAAANSGSLESSGIEGARASIGGQAGVNLLGVEHNREVANQMFVNNRQMGALKFNMEGASARGPNYAGALGGLVGDNAEELTRLLKWGAHIS